MINIRQIGREEKMIQESKKKLLSKYNVLCDSEEGKGEMSQKRRKERGREKKVRGYRSGGDGQAEFAA